MAHYILNQHVGVATSVIDNNDKRTLKSHTFIVALERVLERSGVGAAVATRNHYICSGVGAAVVRLRNHYKLIIPNSKLSIRRYKQQGIKAKANQ
jgi:hypothetical protein